MQYEATKSNNISQQIYLTTKSIKTQSEKRKYSHHNKPFF